MSFYAELDKATNYISERVACLNQKKINQTYSVKEASKLGGTTSIQNLFLAFNKSKEESVDRWKEINEPMWFDREANNWKERDIQKFEKYKMNKDAVIRKAKWIRIASNICKIGAALLLGISIPAFIYSITAPIVIALALGVAALAIGYFGNHTIKIARALKDDDFQEFVKRENFSYKIIAALTDDEIYKIYKNFKSKIGSVFFNSLKNHLYSYALGLNAPH